MPRNVACLYSEIVCPIGLKVQKAATRNIVFSIHQVKVAFDWVHHDAVWHGDRLHFGRGKQVGINGLVGSNVYKSIADGVLFGGIVPRRAIII